VGSPAAAAGVCGRQTRKRRRRKAMGLRGVISGAEVVVGRNATTSLMRSGGDLGGGLFDLEDGGGGRNLGQWIGEEVRCSRDWGRRRGAEGGAQAAAAARCRWGGKGCVRREEYRRWRQISRGWEEMRGGSGSALTQGADSRRWRCGREGVWGRDGTADVGLSERLTRGKKHDEVFILSFILFRI
jgi:hypothetical protein